MCLIRKLFSFLTQARALVIDGVSQRATVWLEIIYPLVSVVPKRYVFDLTYIKLDYLCTLGCDLDLCSAWIAFSTRFIQNFCVRNTHEKERTVKQEQSAAKRINDLDIFFLCLSFIFFSKLIKDFRSVLSH